MCTKAKGDRLKVVDLPSGWYWICCALCLLCRPPHPPGATNQESVVKWTVQAMPMKQADFKSKFHTRQETRTVECIFLHKPQPTPVKFTDITDAGVKDRVITDHKRWCHLTDLHHQHYLLSYSCFIFIAYQLLMELGSSNSQRMMGGRHLK